MFKTKQVFMLGILCYFMQGLEGIGSQAFSFYLKNLGWSPSKAMYVGGLISLAWVIKPLMGILIDNFKTRKFWIMSSVVGSLFICSLIALKLPIWFVIPLMFFANWNTAQRDIACDGISCEVGKDEDNNHSIQSIQWGTITISGIIVGLVGGYITEHFHYSIGFLMLIPFYILMLYMFKDLHIGKTEPKKIHVKELFVHKRFLWCCLFILFFNFSPGYGKAIYYLETDKFMWSQQFIGTMTAISAVCALLGAICYQKWFYKLNIKRVIVWSVLISAISSLAYLWITPIIDISFTILFSYLGMIVKIATMTWMAKISINGLESTSFACLCGISNLAAILSEFSGAFLLDKIGLNPLIIVSATTSLICLLFIKKIFDTTTDNMV